MYLRDVVTLIAPILCIALVLGFLAWRDRHLLVSVVASAALAISALFAGYAVFVGYLLALTPPAPPGVIDWTYGYDEPTVQTAILLGLGVAAAIVIVASALFVRLRKPTRPL